MDEINYNDEKAKLNDLVDQKAEELGLEGKSRSQVAQKAMWEVSPEDKAKLDAMKNLKKELRKIKGTNPTYAKQMLAGLEALEVEFNAHSQGEFEDLLTASNLTKADKATSNDMRMIDMRVDSLGKIAKTAKKKQKKIENKKIAGKKIGDALSQYQLKASELVQAVLAGKSPEVVVNESIQIKQTTGFTA